MIAESLNFPKTIVLWILKGDLGKRKLCGRFVPNPLTPEQREDRYIVSRHYHDGRYRQKFFKQNYYGRWDLVFCLWPRNKATQFWMGWWDMPSAEDTEIPKVPHQDHVDNFFRLSRLSAQRIRTRWKKVNAEFYKGVMDFLLKCIQCVRPAAICSRDFFLHAHKDASVANFWPTKNVTALFNPRTLQIYFRQIIFCSPSWKWS